MIGSDVLRVGDFMHTDSIALSALLVALPITFRCAAPPFRVHFGWPKPVLVPLIGILFIFFACPSRTVLGVGLDTFVNWENAPIHPMDLSPDGTTLAVCNLPDNRVELFDVTTGTPEPIGSVVVGLDPVSARFRSNGELWVVNHISDSVSIVDLTTRRVVATLRTLDEPADVVFAGAPLRAYVSCSQVNTVQVYDPESRTLESEIAIDAEDPRSMAVSPDGMRVYVAIFESGNGTTLVAGGRRVQVTNQFGVNDPNGPYGGENPPPNSGLVFDPPINPQLPEPPDVALIVRKTADGRWVDDNDGDWTEIVTGSRADRSGRPQGWDLPDRDVAVIDTETLNVTYATRLMNICASLAVNPATGAITVVGMDATNQIRFEPVLNGRFLRVNLALVDPDTLESSVIDLNPHLDYSGSTIAQSERDKSIGDPRAIVWNAAGTRAYVTGMGSNNLLVIDAAGARAGLASTIELGEGPTGLVLDDARQRLYVLNRFEASISVVDTTTEEELTRVAFFDPTPEAIKIGRKHLYDTHKTSGLGHIACASCHVDARMDRLAWDLGDPTGSLKSLEDQNLGMGFIINQQRGFPDFHPMKGPMMTQTFQDIIGHEPFHWRGDRDGLEEFNPAFMVLLGDDLELTPAEMQEFEDFLATIAFPPNPFREMDNSLPEDLPLDGHFATGRFILPLGAPLPNGNAMRGLDLFRGVGGRRLDTPFSCVTCHVLPTGGGADVTWNGAFFVPIPLGPNGEHHVSLMNVDTSTNVVMRVAPLRNLHEKVGLENLLLESRAGFGFLHDGSDFTLASFFAEAGETERFSLANDQELADMIAFTLAFPGSDLPEGPDNDTNEPPGPPSKDTHAAVGAQVTIDTAGAQPIIAQMLALAAEPTGRVDLIVRGSFGGMDRSWFLDRASNLFQSDLEGEFLTPEALEQVAGVGSELTYTLTPRGAGRRIGIDRDADGILDRNDPVLDGAPVDPTPTPTPVPPPSPRIVVTGGPLDFGEQLVDDGRTETQTITITNFGDADLLFLFVDIEPLEDRTGDFFVDIVATLDLLDPLRPGRSRTVEVGFNPKTPGPKEATLRIFTNDIRHDNSRIFVDLTGVGIVPNRAAHWDRYR